MKKKLLIVGGSYADIPIIKEAKESGFFVITTGNNPDELGHLYSDAYYKEDYSIPENILQLAQKLKIDYICSSSNDFSAISCAYVAEKLSLPGHDIPATSLIIHHKDKFRKFASKHKLSVPKSMQIFSYADIDSMYLNYPIIVKPIDMSGGKGITKVDSKKDLRLAINKAFEASKETKIIIEEFIEGSNHGYSTFIKNGKIMFAFMDDEHYFVNPYLVSGASTSLSYSQEISKKLNIQLELLASKLNLVDGLLHVQFILKDASPYIVEVCRRTPGDLYVKLVEYATGFNMSDAIVKSVTNSEIQNYNIYEIKYITRHCVMSPKNGIIKKINYANISSKIFDKMTFYKINDEIINYLTYKAEIDFIKYENKEDMMQYINKLTSNIMIELK